MIESFKPRLHEQFVCGNFYVTSFICSCTWGHLLGFYVANTFAEKLVCQFLCGKQKLSVTIASICSCIWLVTYLSYVFICTFAKLCAIIASLLKPILCVESKHICCIIYTSNWIVFVMENCQTKIARVNGALGPCIRDKITDDLYVALDVNVSLGYIKDTIYLSNMSLVYGVRMTNNLWVLGPVHTYADIFENGGFFLRFGVASTRKRRFRHAKTEVFENALQSGGFIQVMT